MSHTYFNGLWSQAQQEFRALIKEERKEGILTGTRSQIVNNLSEFYFKYVSIYKKLDTAYDQMVHPQKRPLVRRFLDLTLARILEIRDIMVKAELSEYFYQDEYLHWLHWIPKDLDIQIPKYYKHGRGPEWLERQVLLEGEAARMEAEDKVLALEAEVAAEEAATLSALKADLGEEIDMTYDEAVRIIQTVERARQGQGRYHMAKYFMDQEEAQRKKKKLQKQAAEGKEMDPNKAAVIIQRLVRRFLARRYVHKRREEELEFLGLSWGPHRPTSQLKETLDKQKKWGRQIELAAERRRRMQRRYYDNFIEAEITIEARLRSLEALEMAERMKWQIRTWALDVKEKKGKLPELPKADHGGSKFLFCPDKLAPEVLEKTLAALEGKNKKKGKKDKAKAAREKALKKKKALEKKLKDKKKKKKGSGVEPLVLSPPKNFDDMLKSNVEYNKEWRRRDETHNPEQRHEDGLIIHTKRELVGNEVRAQVDTVMRAELKLLKIALEKKKGKKKGKGKGKGKGKKGKKSKGKKGKGKTEKKGRKGKKKKKKGKDLTKDRSLESIYQELIRNRIIKKYPKIEFKDLQGEYSLINGSIRNFYEGGTILPMPNEDLNVRFPGDSNPPPTFGDVKRAVKDICVLPVGSKTVHEIAPFTKSLLLAGPEGTGKHSLVHAVCTEMGATLMDLTAKNIAGKYPGKGKTGLKMLMHLVGKVGRLCHPTVILIDNCEKMFQKKVPKEEKKTEPKRLRKSLKKLLKTVDEEDPIILIGITSQPWKAPLKPLKKLYQKMIYIPKPEYGSRLNWWRTMLWNHIHDLSTDINYSLLAKLSESWTLGAIKKVVEKNTKKFYGEVGKDKEKPKIQQNVTEASTQTGTEDPNKKSLDYNSKNTKPPINVAPASVRTPSTSTSGHVEPINENQEKETVRKLIRMDDLLKEISLQDPVFLEMDKAWNKWFNKTPLQKARIASIRSNMDGKKKKRGRGRKEKETKKGKKKSKGKKR